MYREKENIGVLASVYIAVSIFDKIFIFNTVLWSLCLLLSGGAALSLDLYKRDTRKEKKRYALNSTIPSNIWWINIYFLLLMFFKLPIFFPWKTKVGKNSVLSKIGLQFYNAIGSVLAMETTKKQVWID